MPKPNLNVFLFIVIIIGFVFLVVLGSIFVKRREPGQAAEEQILKTIKNFLKNNHYKKADYLLVNNLILQKQNY